MRYLLSLLILIVVQVAFAGWEPQENPDPEAILRDAREDTRAERYESALVKHLWFHNNALKHQRSLYGVRLSFALSDWKELASKYPPALEKMKQVRDEAEAKVKDDNNPYGYFHDFQSLNETLGSSNKTVALFVWLDANKANVARKVYRIAQPSLIEYGRYKLAAKYVEPLSSYARIVNDYNQLEQMVLVAGGKWDEEIKKQQKRFAREDFTHSTTTLVALLVKNDKVEEAKEIADQALLEIDTPAFRRQLDKALQGDIPPKWP